MIVERGGDDSNGGGGNKGRGESNEWLLLLFKLLVEIDKGGKGNAPL